MTDARHVLGEGHTLLRRTDQVYDEASWSPLPMTINEMRHAIEVLVRMHYEITSTVERLEKRISFLESRDFR